MFGWILTGLGAVALAAFFAMGAAFAWEEGETGPIIGPLTVGVLLTTVGLGLALGAKDRATLGARR